MTNTKDKWTSLAATLGIHALLLLGLLFYYASPYVLPENEELEGIPVMFGNVEESTGNDEPMGRGENAAEMAPNEETVALPQPAQVSKPQQVNSSFPSKVETTKAPKSALSDKAETKTQNVVTQSNEQTIALEQARKMAEQKAAAERAAAERLRQEQIKAQSIAQAEAEQKAATRKKLSGLFGNSSGSGSRGTGTSGTGTQGVVTGNSSTGRMTGTGGFGTYDLGGRSVGSGGLVKPAYTVDDYGTVVVDIWVNPAGKVVEASIGRGTNTASATLRSEALKAARRTLFQAVDSNVNQKGTITYKFNLN